MSEREYNFTTTSIATASFVCTADGLYLDTLTPYSRKQLDPEGRFGDRFTVGYVRGWYAAQDGA